MSLLSYALVTLSEAKSYVRIPQDNEDHDDVLKQLINSATDIIESYVDTPLKYRGQALNEQLSVDAPGQRSLFPIHIPVGDIESIRIDSNLEFPEHTTRDSDSYAVSPSRTEIIALPNYSSWPRGVLHIRVNAHFGYGAPGGPDLPYDLKLAALMVFSRALKTSGYKDIGKGELGMTSVTKGGDTIQRVEALIIPNEARTILEPYKRIRAV